MYGKKHKESASTILIKILFFLKPIIDILYQFQFLDIVMLFLLFLIFVSNEKRIRVYKSDMVIFLFIALLIFSLLNDISGFKVFVKITSPIVLFFTLRNSNMEGSMEAYLNSYKIVVLVSVLAMILGIGTVQWGDTFTFKGFYFYKTDFACAMTQAIIVFLYYYNVNKRKRLLFYVFMATALIFLSNSRASLLVVALLFAFSLFVNKYKKGDFIKFKLRYFVYISLAIVAVLFVSLSFLKTSALQKYAFLTIDFRNLFSESNTQGRTVIWGKILALYSNSSTISHIFGIDLISDVVMHNGALYGSHSMFIKILFSTGIVGEFLFIFLLIKCILKGFKQRKKARLILWISTISMFIINGITISVIEFTQFTWFVVMIVSYIMYENRNKVD